MHDNQFITVTEQDIESIQGKKKRVFVVLLFIRSSSSALIWLNQGEEK